MTITVTGILKNPQGVAIQNAEIFFEQTQSSDEVLQGSTTTVITSATGSYSFALAVGTYVLKIRQQNELNKKTVASNILVISSMNNYSINQILVDQAYMENIDYDILEEVFQARDQQIQAANSASASQADALQSKNAAQTSATNAANSASSASTSATNAQTSATNAQNSATSAASSSASALASKNAASASEANANTYAANALASKNAAQTSATNAATSETNALSSKNAAQTSATNAATSETNALASKNAAQTSATNAQASETNALSSKNAAQASATQASTSATNASNSATQAATSATSANNSSTQATTSATNALNSENKAFKWQENPEDSAVEAGKYSAKHWAIKSQQYANQAAGALIWRGGWSAQQGNAPPTPTNTADFYRITAQGTILSVSYDIGDYIHWDTVNLIWFKMDGTDSVISVNGKSGQVTLNQSDVGAVAKAGDTMTGSLVITKNDSGLILNPAANTASYILGQQAGVANWYIGKGSSATNDVVLHSYQHNTALYIMSDRVQASKALYVGANKVWTASDLELWESRGAIADLNAVSSVLPGYYTFNPSVTGSPDQASYGHGFSINPGTNGGAGVWSTQFAVTHTGGKLWYRNGINGAATGAWSKIYSSTDKPTADDLSVVNRAGDTMTGLLTITKSADGIKFNPQAGTSSYILGQQAGVNNWSIGKGGTSDDVSIISYAHSTNMLLKSDRITADKPFATSVQQSTLPESMTRRDFVESSIAQAGTKSITIAAPAGVVQNMYYPVVFTNISNKQNLYISTTGGSSTAPMNSCSFQGQVRAWGYGDQGSTVDGMFTIYTASERAIHSIHRSSESSSYAVYVEGRSFPLEIAVDGTVTVTCTGQDTPIGTSIYTVNQTPGVGNTKTMMMVDFNRGQGKYVQSSTSGGLGALYYTTDNKPTATDVGALPITGGTLTGQLLVRQSGSSAIVIDSTGATDSQLQFQRNNSLRWLLGRDSTTESGANVGSDLSLYRYNDNGTYAGAVFKVRRSTGVVELDTNPTVSSVQSSDVNSLTKKEYVDQGLASKLNSTGGTLTGLLVVNRDSEAIRLDSLTDTSIYIRGAVAGVDNWYVGRSGSNNHVALHSYSLDTNITLEQDRVTSNRSLYVGSTGKVYHTDSKPTLQELSAASAYENSATRLIIDRRLAGSSEPTKTGKWMANNTTFTPAPYGTITVTSNSDVEDLVSGTGNFNFYQFHDTYDNRLYLRSDVNGVVSGWDTVMTSKGSPLAVNLNTLNASRFIGNYYQDTTVNATLGNNYPVQEAGHLVITRGPYGVIQEYTTFSSNRKFVRGMSAINSFSPWEEIATGRGVHTNPSWTAPWAQYAGYPSLQVTVAGPLRVITGMCSRASGSAGDSVVATIPSGHRPNVTNTIFVCMSSTGPVRVDVEANGVVTARGLAAGAIGWLNLSGIVYAIA